MRSKQPKPPLPPALRRKSGEQEAAPCPPCCVTGTCRLPQRSTMSQQTPSRGRNPLQNQHFCFFVNSYGRDGIRPIARHGPCKTFRPMTRKTAKDFHLAWLRTVEFFDKHLRA
jgi:hypothetical protein